MFAVGFDLFERSHRAGCLDLHYDIEPFRDAISIESSLKSPPSAVARGPIADRFRRGKPSVSGPSKEKHTTKLPLNALPVLVDFFEPLFGWAVHNVHRKSSDPPPPAWMVRAKEGEGLGEGVPECRKNANKS